MARVAITIGRFQTHRMHAGYDRLFNGMADAGYDRLIVFLGVPLIGLSKRNPLDFQQREAMLREYLESTCETSFTILPILDNPMSDIEWSNNLDKLIISSTAFGDSITLYYSRDGFGPRYSGRFKKVEITTDIKHSATEDRSDIKTVPRLSEDFRAGVIYTTQNVFHHARSVVDVVVFHDNKILMGRKEGETSWRVIGGFTDTTDFSLEETVSRELKEETNLNIQKQPVYLGSFKINDYRFKDVIEYSIMSSLFLVENPIGEAIAGDDLIEIEWFNINDVLNNTREEHKKLVSKALSYLYNIT